MTQENINQQFNSIIKMKQEIISMREQTEVKWLVKAHCAASSYVEHLLISAFVVTGCISAFASLVGIPTSITSSAVWLKICAITQKMESISESLRKRKRSRIK